MSLLSWILAVLNWLCNFLINQLGGLNPFRPIEVNILLFFHDAVFRNQMVSLFGDERDPMDSWVSIIGNIKYKFFSLGGCQMAHRVLRDYGKMDAVVYVVDAEALTQGGHLGPQEELNAQLWDHFRDPRKELNALLSDEAFAGAPFLIYGLTTTVAFFQLEGILCRYLELSDVAIGPEDANAGRLKVFVAPAFAAQVYQDALRWLSHYIE